MTYKDFPDSLWQEIQKELDLALQSEPEPVAAFDADGTLWATDLGESFFQYQIKHNLLPNVFAKHPDPWKYYRDWKGSGDPRPAYLWLAQINAGQKLTTVQDWAMENVKTQIPFPFFEPQKKLIQLFLQKKVKVFVVTASVAWAVEPGAELLGIPRNQVLGVRTKTDHGIILSDQDGEITYRAGKAKALLDKNQGKKPFFACGNTLGDLALLESANFKLAVRSAPVNHELFRSEEELFLEVSQRSKNDTSWWAHHF